MFPCCGLSDFISIFLLHCTSLYFLKFESLYSGGGLDGVGNPLGSNNSIQFYDLLLVSTHWIAEVEPKANPSDSGKNTRIETVIACEHAQLAGGQSHV